MSNATEQHDNTLLGKLVQTYEIGKLGSAAQIRIFLYLIIAIAFVFWLFTLPTDSNEGLVWWRQPLENIGFFTITIAPLLAFCVLLISTSRKKGHNQVLFHERGLKAIKDDKVSLAQYKDLKISQIISGGKIRLCTYTLWFPNGYSLTIADRKVAETTVRAITRVQLPIVLRAYQQGVEVDFGSVRINRKGMEIKAEKRFLKAASHPNSELILWSDIKHVETNFRLGRLFVHRTKGKTIPMNFGSGETYNLSVFLGLLKHLGHIQAPRQSIDI